MKIGILTLNLHSNYGGILQAYALQTVLQRMGHEVKVIHRGSMDVKINTLFAPLIYAKRIIKKYIKRDNSVNIFLEQAINKENAVTMQYTRKFIAKYINHVHCAKYSQLSKEQFDVIVVGSDQVWRPKYFGYNIIGDAYLKFAEGWNVKRVAYAASFGTDEWEYTPEQTAICKDLLSKFDAVSVREDSAVALCDEHFSVAAKHVLDPTMLLDKSDYISLVNASDTSKSCGNLLVYVLDETDDKQKLINDVAGQKQLVSFRTNSKIEDSAAPLSERIQPPVENWLRGFMDAEFVVTDSFHACVFSILFNKPFVVYGNESRGRARFDSLLRIFGLESQYVTSSEDLDVSKCSNINWDAVNDTLAKYREKSAAILESNI